MNSLQVTPPKVVDVREDDEWNSGHIPGACHLPLSRLDKTAPDVLEDLRGRRILLVCRSGARARLARNRLMELGYVDPTLCEVFDGGMEAWQKQNGPVRAGTRTRRLPVMQQVQVLIGLLVGSSSLGAWFVSPKFLAVPIFISGGLLFAGLSGRCLMAELLAKLPFNRPPQEQ